MAAVSLFWDTNMAAVMSCENTLLGYPASVINPSTVFSTFDMDKLVKIQGHHWKKHLKISELAKFESDNYVLGERRYNAAKLGKFTYVCILGSNFALLPPLPQHTNVCKLSQLWGTKSSTVVKKSFSNLAILLI